VLRFCVAQFSVYGDFVRLCGRDFVAREQKSFATANPTYRVRAVLAAAHFFSLQQGKRSAHPKHLAGSFVVWRLRFSALR
jgi:hypothetical protein